jgi:hypothetical protein
MNAIHYILKQPFFYYKRTITLSHFDQLSVTKKLFHYQLSPFDPE